MFLMTLRYTLFTYIYYLLYAVVETFSEGSGKVKVNYFACALKELKEGVKYFHTALKLSGPKCWLSAKNAFSENIKLLSFFKNHIATTILLTNVFVNLTLMFITVLIILILQEIGSPRTKNSTKAYRKNKITKHKQTWN